MKKNILYKVLEFEKVEGRCIARQPWPMKFLISDYLLTSMEVELRPLTITGFLKAVSKNFVTMNYHRFLRALFKCGFFRTKEFEAFSWKHFTFKFWTHKK